LALAEAEAKAKAEAEERQRVAEEKRLAALEAARKEKEVADKMNNLSKDDPEYIAARKEFIAENVNKAIGELEQSSAEQIQRETEEFNTANETAYN